MDHKEIQTCNEEQLLFLLPPLLVPCDHHVPLGLGLDLLQVAPLDLPLSQSQVLLDIRHDLQKYTNLKKMPILTSEKTGGPLVPTSSPCLSLHHMIHPAQCSKVLSKRLLASF